MPIDVKIEKTQDLQKIVTITTTRQDVSDFEPNANLRSYRKELVDGVTTIVEEILDLGSAVYQGQIDGSTSTEPLITHDNYKDMPQDIRDKWTKYQLGRDVGTWKPDTETNAIFLAFWQKYSKGVESYFSARITLRSTALESGPPDQTNVGYIDEGWHNIGALQIPAGVDFLLTAARGTQEGEFWRNTYEWTGSSPHGYSAGWDVDLYHHE